jgi:hypothetical protein
MTFPETASAPFPLRAGAVFLLDDPRGRLTSAEQKENIVQSRRREFLHVLKFTAERANG